MVEIVQPGPENVQYLPEVPVKKPWLRRFWWIPALLALGLLGALFNSCGGSGDRAIENCNAVVDQQFLNANGGCAGLRSDMDETRWNLVFNQTSAVATCRWATLFYLSSNHIEGQPDITDGDITSECPTN